MKTTDKGLQAGKLSKNTVNVLLVDDDPNLLKVTKQILEAENNFTVETANSVQEANVKLAHRTFDVIVSDYEMPITDGLEFLEEQKATQNRMPFILFTGRGREEVAIKALNIGADGYINKHGNPETVYGELSHCIRQTTEKNYAEKALQESEERLKTIVQNAPIGIATVGYDHYIKSANEEFCKIIGYTETELQKITFKEFTHSEDLQQSITKMADLTAGKISSFKLEKRYIKKDKTLMTGKVVVSAIPGQQSKSSFYIVELEDITEHKKSETALKQSEERLKIVVQNAPIGIATIGLDNHFLSANEAFCKNLGYTETELQKLTFNDLTHPESIPESLTKMQELTSGKISSFKIEKQYIKKDQNKITGKVVVSIIRDQHGNPSFFIAQLEDITEHKNAEAALIREHDKLNAIAENVGAGIAIVNKDYKIIYANKLIKANRGEIEGKLCYTTLNNLTEICPDCSVKKIFEQNSPRDSHEYLSPYSSPEKPTWLEIIATPLKDNNGNIIAALEVTIDISEKKQKEKELKESQQKFKAIFNENPEAICFSDTDHHVIEVNTKFSSLFGYAPEEIIGKSVFETIIAPEKEKEALRFINQIFEHGIDVSGIIKHKDGSSVHASVSVAPIIVEERKIGYVCVYSDISDAFLAHKNSVKALNETLAAKRELVAALKKAELLNDKLEVIGSFIRHDVRNKLTTITGNTFLAKKQVQNNRSLIVNLIQIEAASRNIVRILEFSKAYEALGNQALAPTNAGKAIDEAASLFADLHGTKIINECQNLNVLADQMLTTVFHNLIDNSLRHGETVSQIKIHTQTTPTGTLKIIYEDNGAGIPQNMKKQLFQKGTGKGTGYGLYLIKRTCDIYGWTITEQGTENKGAKFEFTIPKNKLPKPT